MTPRVHTLSIPLGPIRISVKASASITREPGPPSPASRRHLRRRLALAALVLLALAGALTIALAAIQPSAPRSLYGVSPPDMGRGATFSPIVRRTSRPPTGYRVTFRYRDPAAKLVQIEGQWSFSSPSLTTIEHSQGLPPSQWKPGEFVVDPNQAAEFEAGVN